MPTPAPSLEMLPPDLSADRAGKTGGYGMHRFVRPRVGFEVFARGQPIGSSGDERIVAPGDDCTVFMPSREPIVGHARVDLTWPLA